MYLLKLRDKKGFNLLGIIVSMAIILIIAGIVLFGDDPDKEIGNARDAKRATDIAAISKAIDLYLQDNNQLPADFASTSMAAGEKYVLCNQSASLTCDGQTRNCMVIDDADFIGKYISSIPVDPKKTDESDSGYYVTRDSNTSAITVGACESYDSNLTIESITKAKIGTCGDSICQGQENVANCAADCPAVCGDSLCSAGENAGNCEADCSASCGDTYCSHTETCDTCSADCGVCPNRSPIVSDAGRVPTNGTINVSRFGSLFSWNSWTDPDGDSVEYYATIYNGFNCSASVKENSGWQTPNAMGPAAFAYSSNYSWQVKGRSTTTPTSDETAYNTCYNFTIEDAPKSSCPFVYLWDGKEYNYLTDIKGQPIGFPTDHFKSQKTSYFMPNQEPLHGFEPVNGEYKIKFRETLKEMDYFDELKLMLVDHPSGYEVYSSTADDRLSLEDKKHPLILYTVKDAKLPISAIDQNGKNVLDKVSFIDNQLAQDYEIYDSYVELDFGKINPKYAKLVIDGWTTYQLDRPFKKPFFPYVEVVNENGEWEKVAEFGYVNGDLKTIIVELYDKFRTDDQRVRVHVGYHFVSATFLDRIRMDDSKPIDLDIITVEPSSAKLYHAGSTRYIYATENHRVIEVKDNNHKDITNRYFYGNFTKYGEVSELLKAADNKFVILRHGDALEVTFPSIKEPKAGMERTPVLHADVLYKIIYDNNSGKYSEVSEPYSIYPLPFKGMSQYPYDTSKENYPDTQEYKDYLNTWNTRACDEGKDYCYDLDTGYKILYSYKKEELDIAAYRLSLGIATKEDIKNLEHATEEYAYQYNE